MTAAPVLAGTEDHPHARMVLGSGLASGTLSHAYLFHGPPGTGKRTAARALAAEILAADPATAWPQFAHALLMTNEFLFVD
jgi:DNA polymerase-3 subunit delta'